MTYADYQNIVKNYRNDPSSVEAISALREVIHIPQVQKMLSESTAVVEQADKEFGFDGMLIKANQVKGQIRKFLYTQRARKEDAEKLFDETKEIISNPLAYEMLANELDNNTFHTFATMFEFPPSVWEKRKKLDQEIIFNPGEKSLPVVKEAMADLIFHDCVHNVMIKIRTIRETVHYRPEMKAMLDVFEQMFSSFEDFASLPEGTSTEQLNDKILKLCNLNKAYFDKGVVVSKEVKRFLEEAEMLQEAEVKYSCTEGANKILKGLDCQELESADGKKTQFYKVEKQTENQDNFFLLVRVFSLSPKTVPDYSMNDYFDYTKAHNCDSSCYSIINQSMLKSFFEGETTICLVYGQIGDECELINSTNSDGQTFQRPFFTKGRYIFQQQYYPLDDFIKEHSSHTEISFTNASKIKPAFIYSSSQTPSQLLIKRATQMGLPIVYINPESYVQCQPKERTIKTIMQQEYHYEGFVKEPLANTDYYETENHL